MGKGRLHLIRLQRRLHLLPQGHALPRQLGELERTFRPLQTATTDSGWRRAAGAPPPVVRFLSLHAVHHHHHNLILCAIAEIWEEVISG